MRSLSIAEFRRRLMEDLPDEGITSTKRGQPLARITPLKPHRKGGADTLPRTSRPAATIRPRH